MIFFYHENSNDSTDKIGDLVCTLPIDQATFLKEHNITWLIQDGMQFILNHAKPRRTFQIINKNKQLHSFLILLDLLKNQHFDMAISFQCPWWVHLALWVRKVSIRVGALSQWHSFLFLNKGLRQKDLKALNMKQTIISTLYYMPLISKLKCQLRY